MKLFQRLLVAPAALGLMAPMAATAAELNINDVSNYSSSGAATQSISDFSDVHPSDWAYQALNNLRKRSGCTAASPNGSMTRYEAAALLNKCLGNVAQFNEEEQSLVDEFSAELAAIKGHRLEGVEAGVDHSGHGHESLGFSPSTKIHSKTIFLVGGVNSGDSGTNDEAVTFTYHNIIEAETSFNGSDLLLHEIEACNSGDTPFTGEAALESACDDGNGLTLARSFYQFPVGSRNDTNFTATIGARVRQDQMLGVWPSAYPTDSVLDVLTYAGANAAYPLTVGAGAGITYAKDNFSASLLVVSESEDAASSSAGVLTTEGSDDVTTQIAWLGDSGFTIAAAYTMSDGGCNPHDEDAEAGAINTCSTAELRQSYDAFGISASYEIDNDDSLFIPASISAGFGWSQPHTEVENNDVEDEQTWTVGLVWDSNFGYEGSNLGFAIGSAEGHRDDSGYDDPLAYEVYYSMPVSDNITVTPAFFSIEKNGADDYTGGVVKTTFTF